MAVQAVRVKYSILEYHAIQKEQSMGGAGIVTSGKGGRKSLDAAINLVPFIDLLSCCLAFLLITAVWVNLGNIAVPNATPGSAVQEQSEAPKVRFTLAINAGGYVLQASTGAESALPRIAGNLDEQGLSKLLYSLRSTPPGQQDLTVRSSDTVLYAELVKTLDIARGANFLIAGVTSWNN